MLKRVLRSTLALLMIATSILGWLPAIDGGENDNPLVMSAEAASVTGGSGSGTWISGKLTYSYSTATADSNTTDAAGSASINGSVLTVKATNAKEYTTGSGCDASTTNASATTTTVTVKSISESPLKITTLTRKDVTVSGISLGDTLQKDETFTVSITAPAKTDATEVTGTLTIGVEEISINNEVTFLSVHQIDGVSPGSYTVTSGGSPVALGTHQTTMLTEYTLSAAANSDYIFNGWLVNGNLVSTNTTLTLSFKESNASISVIISGAKVKLLIP